MNSEPTLCELHASTVPLQPAEVNGDVHVHVAADLGGGWLSDELWRARVDRTRAQYARDDENALLNATLKL